MDDLIPLIKKFEAETGVKVHTSGMPYIRTLNSQSIIDEIGFVYWSGIVGHLAYLFLLFPFLARHIYFNVYGDYWGDVGLWVFGLMHYEITVLTALIPPLIIVIGIPNCIFLINKYQQEIKQHGNQAKSLQRVITKVGNATLMTNLTTASGLPLLFW